MKPIPEGQEDRGLILGLLNRILENLKQEESKQEDPFECYAIQLRLHFYKKQQNYEKKFLRGCQLLLAQNSEDKKDQ